MARLTKNIIAMAAQKVIATTAAECDVEIPPVLWGVRIDSHGTVNVQAAPSQQKAGELAQAMNAYLTARRESHPAEAAGQAMVELWTYSRASHADDLLDWNNVCRDWQISPT